MNETKRTRGHDDENVKMCVDDRKTCSMRVLHHTVNWQSCCLGCFLWCDLLIVSAGRNERDGKAVWMGG